MSNVAGRVNFRFLSTSTDEQCVRVIDEVTLRYAGLEGEICVTDKYARIHTNTLYAVCLTGRDDRESVIKYLQRLPGIEPESVVYKENDTELSISELSVR